MKPLLLDLFCGAGGAAMGYYRAGFDVVGVDIEPQKNYPFDFEQADALTYSLKGFDVIHASPPCQRWSSKTMDKTRHPDLIKPIRRRLRKSDTPYVIENVVGSPLLDPIMLCGSMFPPLGVRRHRLFESSTPLKAPECAHSKMPKRFKLYDHGKWYMSSVVHVFGTGGGKAREHWPEAMGIDWMTSTELVEAIPPDYTQFIGDQLMVSA